jgi:hypothetical protein
MSYRPHFPYQTPSGFVDERAIFPFDYRQAQGATELPGGSFQLNQTLRIDEDANFMWRGISWEYPDPYFFLAGQVAIRLRDCYGNYLSNDFIPILNYAQGYYILQPWQGDNAAAPPVGPNLVAPFSGGMGVAFADEIFCPASGILQVDILGLNSLGSASVGRFMARGVKRRPDSDCSTEFR